GSPAPEARKVDPAGALPLGQQQARDQEPAEDEERVDAQITAPRPADVAVVEEDCDDRGGTQPVERRHVAKSGLRHGLLPGCDGSGGARSKRESTMPRRSRSIPPSWGAGRPAVACLAMGETGRR